MLTVRAPTENVANLVHHPSSRYQLLSSPTDFGPWPASSHSAGQISPPEASGIPGKKGFLSLLDEFFVRDPIFEEPPGKL